MFGRFTLRTNASDLVETFTLLRDPELTPRLKIAPASRVAVVPQSDKTREISLMRVPDQHARQQREEPGAGVPHASVCVATFCASARK
jgi:putative SOS response-associated peptidase YedK